MDNDKLLVGASSLITIPEKERAGGVYLFEKNNGGIDNWGELDLLTAEDITDSQEFGGSVDISQNIIIVGAEYDDNIADDSGAAYIFGYPIPKITKPTEGMNNVCLGDEVIFSIVGEFIDEYQWQIKYNGTSSYIDIVDNDVFYGSTTDTLKVKTKLNMKSAIFRCVVKNSYGEVVSNGADLYFENEVPSITSNHKDTILSADNNCEAILGDYTQDIIATDNCTGELEILQTPEQGTKINGNSNKVILTVKDKVGNSSKVEFNVSVVDKTVPTITCIGSKTVHMDSGGSYYSVNDTEFDPLTLSDNCSGVNAVNDFNGLNTLSGSQLPYGSSTIVWAATDDAGNQNNCMFDVDVEYPTSIEDSQLDDVKLFPNPTSGKVFVQSDDINEITISDIFGKVYNVRLSQKSYVDLSMFSAGLYFMKIKTGKRYITKKIIKE